MALLLMDSFDNYVTADLPGKWTTSGTTLGATVTIGSGNGRRSTNGLRVNVGVSVSNPTAYVQKTLVPSGATAIVGVAILVPASTPGTAGTPLIQILDGATAQVTLRIDQDYLLRVYRGTHGGTFLGVTSSGLTAGVVAYVEVKVLIHPSAGTVDVRINGASVLSATGLNTRNSATAQWTGLVLGIIDAVVNTTLNNSKTIDFDDLYVLDGAGAAPWNGFLGDCRVDVRNPTGAGATTGWTPSAGANWAAVDDASPNGDTDYTSAAAAGLTDTFVTQDAPVVGAAIYGVQHCLWAKKTDAGPATIAPVIRHSGVDYVGANLNPSTAYGALIQVAATNPGTSAAWTEAGFNAAEFGYKRTT